MLILHTYGFPFIRESIKEISVKDIDYLSNATIADGSCSQYPNEENQDIIYMGY